MFLNPQFRPVMRHGLRLGVKHRVVDEVRHLRQTGRPDHELPDAEFVGAHIGTDVIQRPDPLDDLVHRRLVAHIANDHFAGAQLPQRPHLVGAIDQGANYGAPCDKCAHHRTPGFAGCSRNEDHGLFSAPTHNLFSILLV
jgi:hypothetical protein